MAKARRCIHGRTWAQRCAACVTLGREAFRRSIKLRNERLAPGRRRNKALRDSLALVREIADGTVALPPGHSLLDRARAIVEAGK